MSPELEKQLYEKYPEIFERTNGEMPFGFEHGDGWYTIIDALCTIFMHPVKTRRERLAWLENIGVGNEKWSNGDKITYAEINEAKFKLDQALRELPRATQVKEKFGGLRFYVDKANDEQCAAIEFAEVMSVRMCEECGSPGTPRKGGWVRTLCDKHAEAE